MLGTLATDTAGTCPATGARQREGIVLYTISPVPDWLLKLIIFHLGMCIVSGLSGYLHSCSRCLGLLSCLLVLWTSIQLFRRSCCMTCFIFAFVKVNISNSPVFVLPIRRVQELGGLLNLM